MIFSLPRGGIDNTHDNAENQLAECYYNNEDNEYWGYFRALEDLAVGELIAPFVSAAQNPNEAIVGSRTLTLTGLNTLLDQIPSNNDRNKANARVYVTVDPGAGQKGTLLSYTDTVATIRWDTDAGTLGTAFGTATRIVFQADWLAKKALVSDGAMAVVQHAVEKGDYFWALIEGEGVVLAGAAISATESLTSGAQSGEAQPATINAAATTNVDLPGVMGVAKVSVADGELCAANIKCNIPIAKAKGLGRVGPYVQSYQHATV